MTSVLKSSLTYNSSQLVQGDTADATDILVATEDLLDNDKAGRLSVTASDTHVKHLNDAIAAGSGIAKTVTNPSGDEALSLAVDPAVVATLTGSQSLTNKTLVTPTIASMVNANHNHENGAGGGKLNLAALNQSGAVSGDVPTWNGSGWAPAPPGAPVTSPVDVTTIVAGEALAERDFVYLSATGWKKVDIDASPVAMGRLRGLVNQTGGIANGATGSVRMVGEVTGFSGLTANALVFASSTAGGYTQTRPAPSAGGGQVAVVPIGLAVNTSRILLTGPLKMQYRKRAPLANNATLLIEHHDDPFGEGRHPLAFTNAATPISVETYATSNVDTNTPLRGTETIVIDNTGGGTALLGDVSGNERRHAQGITLPRAGYINQVSITFSGNTGSPSGNVTCAIYSDAGGVLGTLLQSTTILNPPASTVNTFVFSSPVALAGGTLYHVLFQADPQSSSTYWTLSYNPSGSYTGGSLKSDLATGTSFPNTFGTLGGTNDLRMSYTLTGADRFSQGFSHSTPADISIIKLWLRKQGTPTGNLTLSIYSDAAGIPNSLLGTSSTIVASTLTGSYDWYEFVFSSPVSVAGSTPYHFVLATTDSTSSTNYVEVGADTSSSSYANGIGQKESLSTWSALGGDFVFDILSIPSGYSEPCVVGRASGGTRDVAVRYDSGVVGVNTATNTLAKNTSGGTLDLTFVVEMD